MDQSIDGFVMYSNLISVSPHCLSPEEGGWGGGGGVRRRRILDFGCDTIKNLLFMLLFNILIVSPLTGGWLKFVVSFL